MPARSPLPSPTDPETRVAGFPAKFEPARAGLLREYRLREMLPTANEIIHENDDFLVVGYSASSRTSDTIVSLAAAAKGVGLSFCRGATLPDPHGVLSGSGRQDRFVRLRSAAVLESQAVRELIDAAVAQSTVPAPTGARGSIVVKSVPAKQRPPAKG